MAEQMPSSFTISSFIVCDDVRRELSGKEILIGVYAEAILLPKFPVRLAKLCFRLTATDVATGTPSMFTFDVSDTDGVSRLHFEQAFPPDMTRSHCVFTFVAPNLKFEKATDLRAHFGIDCVPRFVGKIAIREPSTDQERANVASVGA